MLEGLIGQPSSEQQNYQTDPEINIFDDTMMWMSVSVFPNSSKTTKPNELKFWGMIPLRMQKVLG